MSRYSEVKLIPGPSMNVQVEKVLMIVFLSHQDCNDLNEALADGWELIEVIKHRSEAQDLTGTSFLVGRQKRDS